MIDNATSSGYNREKYNEAIKECSSRIEDLNRRKESILSEIKVSDGMKERVEKIIDDFQNGTVSVCEYNEALVRRSVDSIRVTKDKNLIISIKGGVKITEPLYLKNAG